ncbi:MAG TPA: hypothetical protein VIL37_11615 [Natronosporangium sp.]
MPDPLSGSRDDSSWLAAIAKLPRYVVQPFSLAAVAFVGAIVIAVFDGGWWLSLATLVAGIVVLVIGLRATPASAIEALVSGQAYQPVSDVSATTPVDTEGAARGGPGALSAIETVCFLHTYVREGGSVGRNRIFHVDYFVDLMTAALIPSHLECMKSELANHIRRSGQLKDVTTLACPKRGNLLLLTAVARELGMEPVFVKERPLFGKTLEGIGGRPKVAAVVDDVSSDGDLLVHCVQVLSANGYTVRRAFVLVDRPEGDAEEALAKVGVELVPLFRYSDQDLEALASRGRRFAGSF